MTRQRYELEQYQDYEIPNHHAMLEQWEATRYEIAQYQQQQMMQQMWQDARYAQRDHYVQTENAAAISGGLHLGEAFKMLLLLVGILIIAAGAFKAFGPVRTDNSLTQNLSGQGQLETPAQKASQK